MIRSSHIVYENEKNSSAKDQLIIHFIVVSQSSAFDMSNLEINSKDFIKLKGKVILITGIVTFLKPLPSLRLRWLVCLWLKHNT